MLMTEKTIIDIHGNALRAGNTSIENPANWLIESLSMGSNAAGVTVNDRTALGVSAYFACIRNVSEDLAKLPINITEKKDGSREEADAHPVHWLLNRQPNPEMTAFEFRRILISHAMSLHMGIAQIIRNGAGQPIELWPMDPRTVTAAYDGDGALIYKVRMGGKTSVLRPRDVFVVKGLGFDGVTGYIMSKLASGTLGSTIGAQDYNAAFFANGTVGSGVIEVPGALSETSFRHLQSSFNQRYSGAKNAHKAIILEEDAKWKPTSADPNKTQLVDQLRFSVEDVARWFRMPPHKIGHMDGATFSNIESQSREYVSDTLMPWAVQVEQEAAAKLFPNSPSLSAKHNFGSLLRAEAQARSQFYRELYQIGVFSINDIRNLEDMNPVDGGDLRVNNGAMVPIELLGKNIENQSGSVQPVDIDPEPMEDLEPEPTRAKPKKKSTRKKPRRKPIEVEQ